MSSSNWTPINQKLLSERVESAALIGNIPKPRRNNGFRPQAIGLTPDEQSHRQQKKLRGEMQLDIMAVAVSGNGARVFDDQCQKRWVRKVEEHYTNAENDQRASLKKNAKAGDVVLVRFFSSVSRPVIVDSLGRN